MTKPAKSANDVLSALREDHNWRHDPLDLTSTGGIQRNITALWDAVQALADHADGIVPGEPPVVATAAEAPQSTFLSPAV